jgi:hypothetical protein
VRGAISAAQLAALTAIARALAAQGGR